MRIDTVLKKYEAKEENLLYILHEIQDGSDNNSLNNKDLEEVAAYVGVPLSRVNGVVSFYSMFSSRPRGKYIIRLCQSPPCFIKGSVNVYEKIKQQLKISEDETTDDGLFTLEFSSCLGVCGLAPAMMINDDVYGNLTEERVVEILNNYRNLED